MLDTCSGYARAAKALSTLPRLLLSGTIAMLLALALWLALTPLAFPTHTVANALPNNSHAAGPAAVDDEIAGLVITAPATTTVGVAVTFTAGISAGTDVSYTWDFDDGSSAITQTVVHTYSATGVYSVTVVASNISDTVTATHSIQVLPLPVAGLDASNDSPAEVNAPVTFSATITGGTEISYTWDFGDGSSGSGITSTHAYTQSGIYTATVVASNAANSLTATTTVHIGDAVVGVLNNAYSPSEATVPVGGKVIWVLREGFHSVTADGGSFEQPAGSDWPPFAHTFDNPGTYGYHCTVHFGMVGSVVVQEGPPPVTGLTATNDGPTELGDPTAFTAVVTGGTGITYNWDFGDGNNGTGITLTHTYTESGIYTATVVASNATNSLTETTTVYVSDKVVEVFDNLYSPDEVTVPVGGKVVWVLRGGIHSVTADDGSFEQPAGSDWPPFIHTFNTVGTHDYHCTVHGFSMAGSVIVAGPEEQDKLHLPSISVND